MKDKKDEISEENINKIKKILKQEASMDELKKNFTYSYINYLSVLYN